MFYAARIKRSSKRYRTLNDRTAMCAFVQGVCFKRQMENSVAMYNADKISEADVLQLNRDSSIEIMVTAVRLPEAHEYQELKQGPALTYASARETSPLPASQHNQSPSKPMEQGFAEAVAKAKTPITEHRPLPATAPLPATNPPAPPPPAFARIPTPPPPPPPSFAKLPTALHPQPEMEETPLARPRSRLPVGTHSADHTHNRKGK